MSLILNDEYIRFTNKYNDTVVDMSMHADADMYEVIEQFEKFLRGMGYPLKFDDSLTVVKNELYCGNKHE